MIRHGHLDSPGAEKYRLTELFRDLPADFLRDELWDAERETEVFCSQCIVLPPCRDIPTVLCGLHGAGLLRAIDGVLHEELLALLLPLHQPAVVPGTDGPLHLLTQRGGLAGVALSAVDCLTDWLGLRSGGAVTSTVGWDLGVIN